jgi:hypothetical protein
MSVAKSPTPYPTQGEGMNDHIGKPVDPDRLFETLLKWLEKTE